MLKLYNTLTRKIEEFKPLKEGVVGYYSCGPTVYDFAHIGHARTYVFADVLQRVLEFKGYSVKRVMNITDVGHLTSDSDTGEDKMEKGATREKKSVWDIARFYTEDFFKMLQELHVIKPKIICKATDYIPQMISLIQTLEKKGFTYKVEDGIYFDTTKLKDYGKLTGQTFEELTRGLKAGARIEIVSGKKNPTDFALWKLTPQGTTRQMEWESPWGKGFPGWHIECSAMSMEFLGSTIDIHTGGVDHIPIHHTNEIAQSEAATGKPFVRYWLHGDHLLIDGEKMSKSLKNFYRLSDIIAKGYDPLALRYLFYSASYRQQLNFTWESLQSASNGYTNLKSRIEQLRLESKSSPQKEANPVHLNKLNNDFLDAVNDDLNMSKSLSVLWTVIKSAEISSVEKLSLIKTFDQVLGLRLDMSSSSVESQSDIPENILKLFSQRETYRKEKKWKEADEVRNEIQKQGYHILDTEQGGQVKKI